MIPAKKELLEKFRRQKPEMGVFLIKNFLENMVHMEASSDLRSSLNRARFELDLGTHRNTRLQRDWSRLGEPNFSLEVLDRLDYAKDPDKKDYKEDLGNLLALWKEKFEKEGTYRIYES